jgi:hypothetical protein
VAFGSRCIIPNTFSRHVEKHLCVFVSSHRRE